MRNYAPVVAALVLLGFFAISPVSAQADDKSALFEGAARVISVSTTKASVGDKLVFDVEGNASVQSMTLTFVHVHFEVPEHQIQPMFAQAPIDDVKLLKPDRFRVTTTVPVGAVSGRVRVIVTSVDQETGGRKTYIVSAVPIVELQLRRPSPPHPYDTQEKGK